MLRYWIWLATRKSLSDKDKLRVLAQFATPELAYLADGPAYEQVDGLNEKKINALLDKDLSEAEKILCDCDNKRISILTWQDALYPQRLRFIDNPPIVLYYSGRFPHIDDTVSIGIVGTRKASAYGLKHAKEFGYQLGSGGAIVISGCAEGIDTAAMEGALTAGKPVIGVLGCGVDVVYPRFNKRLYEDVIHNGCLISEYPPKTMPYGSNFPVRNRLISGLALGVLVVEAPEKSGSLITARLALEQGRDVFTIPGSLDMKNMQGNFSLLKDGAILVENGSDILKEYAAQYASISAAQVQCKLDAPVVNIQDSPKREETKQERICMDAILPLVDEIEGKILLSLENGQKHIDEIIEISGLPAAKALTAVTMLEIQGYITRFPGQRFALLGSE